MLAKPAPVASADVQLLQPRFYVDRPSRQHFVSLVQLDVRAEQRCARTILNAPQPQALAIWQKTTRDCLYLLAHWSTTPAL